MEDSSSLDSLKWPDWLVIGGYIIGMIILSIILGKGQKTQSDYYVGGRNMKWWAIGISTMATQTSAISFVSIPAFVALRKGGGLTWLQFELAVPFSMVVVMIFLIPYFREKLQLVSIYEFLEKRFGRASRLSLCCVFLLSRGLGSGVGIYASAIVLSVCLGISTMWTIALIGISTVIYDTIGGVKAVIYSDVIQMAILISGLLLCIILCTFDAGGFAQVFSDFPKERWGAMNWSFGMSRDQEPEISFWPMFFGGIVLYTSYYGADQSQVQRQLSSSSLDTAKQSLLFNGLARFPLTCLYCLLGISLFSFYSANPSFQDLLKSASMDGKRLDYLVPIFIMERVPVGVRALLFSSILAAAMSSLDSALNSLSASTLHDIVHPLLIPCCHQKSKESRDGLLEIETDESGDDWPKPSTILYLSKAITVAWGFLITAFAFLVERMSTSTVIETINQIGSAFYGPILGSFLIGIITVKYCNQIGLLCGIVVGVAGNLLLWGFAPGVAWMWWNLIGFIVFSLAALSVSTLRAFLSRRLNSTFLPPVKQIEGGLSFSLEDFQKEKFYWKMVYAGLISYCVLLISGLIILTSSMAPSQ